MKIFDMILMLPVSIGGSLAKIGRFNLNENERKNIVEEHLYHCTSSEEVANNIIKSGYLRPATGALKTLNSYGHASVCLFAGIPEPNNFMKNLGTNLYVEPEKIANAIEICIHSDELNKCYKARKISDDAILYEGYCVLPENRARVVQLVMDLKRDDKGKPLLGKDGKPIGMEMRKRTMSEIKESPDEYKPKQDYLDFVRERRKEYSMSTKENSISRASTQLLFAGRVANMEMKGAYNTTKKNWSTILRDWKNNVVNFFSAKRLDENADEKITRLTQTKAYLERKNPYDDPKFALSVVKFGYEGIKQKGVGETLRTFSNSDEGKFLRDKYKEIDKTTIRKRGIHGIGHTNRVALLAGIIAENEGIFKGEDADRKREILAFSTYYHDIGRILDEGPHAKRGAKMIEKIGMIDSDGKMLAEKDKRLVQMIIEGHEESDKKIEKLLKKYQISQEDQEMAEELLKVVKDADALDRARLTRKGMFATKTNLDPQYLRYRSSKELMEFSYGLEYLDHNVNDFFDILNYRNEQPNEHFKTKKQKESNERALHKNKEEVQHGRDEAIKIPNVREPVKKTEERTMPRKSEEREL